MNDLPKRLKRLKNELKSIVKELEKPDYIDAVSEDDLTSSEKEDAKTILDYSKYIIPFGIQLNKLLQQKTSMIKPTNQTNKKKHILLKPNIKFVIHVIHLFITTK